jgi:hypothetical protein
VSAAGRRLSEFVDAVAPSPTAEHGDEAAAGGAAGGADLVESLAQISADLLRFLDPAALGGRAAGDSDAAQEALAQALRGVTMKLMQACVAAAEQQDRHARLEEQAWGVREELAAAGRREADLRREVQAGRRPPAHGAGAAVLEGLDGAARGAVEAYVASVARHAAEADEERDAMVLQLLQARGDVEREKQARRSLERRVADLDARLAAARRRTAELPRPGPG